MVKKIIHISGKRKRAIARATLKEGKGLVRINNHSLDTFQDFVKEKISEPLILAGEMAKGINIDVNVVGGGWQGQTEATRLAIARGLVEWHKSDALKKRFLEYDRHLIVADVRRNEPAKPNDSGKPRAKRQKSYR